MHSIEELSLQLPLESKPKQPSSFYDLEQHMTI